MSKQTLFDIDNRYTYGQKGARMTTPSYPWHPTESDLVPPIKERIRMSVWRKYRKTAVQEMRDYIPGEDLTSVSVAPGETPKEGGKIARDNQGSQWYVSPEFMAENYEPV